MRWYIAALAALVMLLQYHIWLSPDGSREVLRLRSAVAEQLAENELLVRRNQQLAAEVRNLKQDFQALEERARSELGLILPTESYYQVVPPAAPQAPAAQPTSATALRAAN